MPVGGQSIVEGPREGDSSSSPSSRRDPPGSGSGSGGAAIEIEVVQAQQSSDMSSESSQVWVWRWYGRKTLDNWPSFGAKLSGQLHWVHGGGNGSYPVLLQVRFMTLS